MLGLRVFLPRNIKKLLCSYLMFSSLHLGNSDGDNTYDLLSVIRSDLLHITTTHQLVCLSGQTVSLTFFKLISTETLGFETLGIKTISLIHLDLALTLRKCLLLAATMSATMFGADLASGPPEDTTTPRQRNSRDSEAEVGGDRGAGEHETEGSIKTRKVGWFSKHFKAEAKQIRAIDYKHLCIGVALIILAIALTVLWHLNPNPCDNDSPLVGVQSFIVGLFGIGVIQLCIEAMGMPPVLGWLLSILVGAMLFSGYWHRNKRLCLLAGKGTSPQLEPLPAKLQ